MRHPTALQALIGAQERLAALFGEMRKARLWGAPAAARLMADLREGLLEQHQVYLAYETLLAHCMPLSAADQKVRAKIVVLLDHVTAVPHVSKYNSGIFAKLRIFTSPALYPASPSRHPNQARRKLSGPRQIQMALRNWGMSRLPPQRLAVLPFAS